MREAAKNHVDKAIRQGFLGLKGGSLTVKSPPEREYRWITSD